MTLVRISLASVFGITRGIGIEWRLWREAVGRLGTDGEVPAGSGGACLSRAGTPASECLARSPIDRSSETGIWSGAGGAPSLNAGRKWREAARRRREFDSAPGPSRSWGVRAGAELPRMTERCDANVRAVPREAHAEMPSPTHRFEPDLIAPRLALVSVLFPSASESQASSLGWACRGGVPSSPVPPASSPASWLFSVLGAAANLRVSWSGCCPYARQTSSVSVTACQSCASDHPAGADLSGLERVPFGMVERDTFIARRRAVLPDADPPQAVGDQAA